MVEITNSLSMIFYEPINLTRPENADGLALDELIERFRAVRQETIRIIWEMKEEDLDREVVHAFHGKG